MNTIVLVRHGNPHEAFEYRELPDPAPGRGEVRVDVEMTGLNFADVLARKGIYRGAPSMPCVLGFDVVGRIGQVGKEVTGLSEGMRVVAMTRFGGYASKVIARACGVVEIPDDLDSAAGTALGTQYTTAWFAAMEMVRLHPNDRVLIHSAAGGVGTALVQLAKLCGCIVVATTRNRDKLHYLRSIGVDVPLCSRNGDVSAELCRLSGGLDVIFDSLGGASVRKGLALLSRGGRIVSYGVSSMSGREMQVVHCIRTLLSFGILSPLSLLAYSKGIIGVNLLEIADERPDIIQHCMRSVVKLAGRGKIHPIVGSVLPYTDVAEAHEMLESGQTRGKTALCWTDHAPRCMGTLTASLGIASSIRQEEVAMRPPATSRTCSPRCGQYADVSDVSDYPRSSCVNRVRSCQLYA